MLLWGTPKEHLKSSGSGNIFLIHPSARPLISCHPKSIDGLLQRDPGGRHSPGGPRTGESGAPD
eukprot:13693492-Alexandrium_andersonii.AAC.1